jgi:hypothetical protein
MSISTPGRLFQAKASAVFAAILGCALAHFFIASTPASAQRLCENNDNPVATISPCTGPAGSTVTVTLGRKLASAPMTLLFKRVVANGVPAQVIVPLTGLTAATPPEMCTGGSGRWEVWLVDSAGGSQGKIGAFWPDCRDLGSSGSIGPTPGPAPGPQRLCENSDSAVANISPCTGPGGTPIAIRLRRTLSSAPAALLFKRVLTSGVPAQFSAPVKGVSASSPPQLCTTGGNGKWEVWLIDAKGASQGVIGAFWPECGGSDACLAGKWLSQSVTNGSPVAPKRGGSGIQLTIGTNGVATINYSGMQPIEQLNLPGQVVNSTIYTGTASAYISAKNGSLTVGTVQSSATSSKITDSRTGKTTGGLLSGLGFVFYGGGHITGYNLNYTCSGGTLVIKHSVGPNLLYLFTFKRQ